MTVLTVHTMRRTKNGVLLVQNGNFFIPLSTPNKGKVVPVFN